MKKLVAIFLTVAMVLAMSVTAFADGEATLTSGEVGGSTFAKDNPSSQSKSIKIAKELKVYNVDEAKINAPTMSYTYAIAAGEADINITDATTDHNNDTAVTVKTKAGAEPSKVTLTGTSANTIAWTPAETVDATTDGKENLKYLTVDFSKVVFGAAGVYRYVLTEAPANYAEAGVTETTANVNKHVRYLDVYVRPAPDGFTDGTKPTDWDIYGYVCLLENEEITDAGDTATKGAVKTNGFVTGENDGTAYLADQYYTYNVAISKTVTNDSYAKATHAFPFTVIFTNETISQPVDISSKIVSGIVTNWTDPASAALSAGNTKGIVQIKDSSSIKYIGIPNGTAVEVYETNDMTGVTYQVTTVANKTGTAETVKDASVTDTTTPTNAVAQGDSRALTQSTKTTFTPTADKDDDVVHTIKVDNNLQLISPTGVTLRVAPYVLILAAGIVLLVLGFKRRTKKEEA